MTCNRYKALCRGRRLHLGTWDHSVLRYDENGLPLARSLYEIFDQCKWNKWTNNPGCSRLILAAVARHPDRCLFRKRVLVPPTKPGEVATYSTATVDTSYATVQRRRNAFGSALLSLERLGRLRDPKLPADVVSPPEITFDGIPAYGDKLNAGARRGWAFGIWSLNREEWQVVDLACQAYGLVSVSLYETLGPDAVKFM